MAVTDYNKKKPLEVTSQNDSGTTQDKAQPVLVTGGDDSTTGTGDIVLDWTNISSESDIAIYDQNGNLLPYEIESFDATAETATLWCYNSWTRDDSVQAQVVYGDGPSSSEENVTGAWDNTGQNAVTVQHLQDDPLTATDSTSNDNDGTVNGATATSGQFDGAASFDGTDDTITVPDDSTTSGLSQITVVGFLKEFDSTAKDAGVLTKWDDNGEEWVLDDDSGDDARFIVTDGSNNFITSTSGVITLGEWYHIAGTWDNTTIKIFFEGTERNSATADFASMPDTAQDLQFASNAGVNGPKNPVDLDAVRVYSEGKSNDWIQADYDASAKAGQVYFSQQAAEDTVQETNETATLTTTIANILTGTETATTSETSQITNVTVNSFTATETSTADENSTLTEVLTNPLTGTETAKSTDSATLTNITANTLQSSETATFETVDEAAQLTTTQAVTITSTETINISETANLTTSTTNLLTASETRDALETATVTQINAKPIQSTTQSTANETAEVTTLTGKLIQAVQEGIVNEVANLTSATAEPLQDDTEAVVNETSETVTAKANALKQFQDIFGRTKKATLDIKKKTKKTFSGDIDK